jgi:WD40 repeat protein
VWDINNNTRRATFTVHTGLGRQVAFSPDGRMLAWDGDNVTLWSVAQGARMATLTNPNIGGGSVASPVFSPDGRMLATTNSYKSVVLWDVDARSWVQRLCSIAGRDLTRAEWAASLPDQPYRSV